MHRRFVFALSALTSVAAAVAWAGHDASPSRPVASDTIRDRSTEATATTIDPREGHHEMPGAATTPVTPGPRVTTPAGTVTFNGFTSVQVNVDANGDNILNDAANEPSIAINPNAPNHMAIGWRQFDSISSDFRQAGYGYSTDGGRTWTFPGVIEPGVFRSDPVLDVDADGNFYYNSLTADAQFTEFTCQVYKSVDGGMTWDAGVEALGGDKQWMAIDRTNGIGRGNIYAHWNRVFSICNGDFTRSVDDGATFVECIDIVSNPFWGTSMVAPDGTLYVCGAGLVVAKSTTVQDPLIPAQFDSAVFVNMGGDLAVSDGPNPSGLLGQAWIDVDRSSGPNAGNIYLVASVEPFFGSDPLDVHFARSTDGGATWSAPVRINDDPAGTNAWQWFGTMSVAPNGRIDVVFNDTRDDPGGVDSQMYYSFSTDAGQTWAPNVAVGPVFDPHLGWPLQAKLGDYYHMRSDDVGASLAYAATYNGEQDVYFLRLGDYDCNVNGIGDEQDILTGTSMDCDLNGIPDECDVPVVCAADTDANCTVDTDDFLAVLMAWGTCPGCPADVTGDGEVDTNDFLAVLDGWGPCTAP